MTFPTITLDTRQSHWTHDNYTGHITHDSQLWTPFSIDFAFVRTKDGTEASEYARALPTSRHGHPSDEASQPEGGLTVMIHRIILATRARKTDNPRVGCPRCVHRISRHHPY